MLENQVLSEKASVKESSTLSAAQSFSPTVHAYRPEIDGLRAIAVLVVVLFHAGLGLSGGYVGVDVFFVISGYLITTIIAKQIQAGSLSMAEFYERRIRRIAPALVAMLATTLAIGWFVALPDEYQMLGHAVISQPLMMANVYHWQNSGYFSPRAETLPLLHTWSLAVEEQFYLVFPLLMMFISRFRKSCVLSLAVALCVLSLGISVWGTPRYPSASFYLLPTRAWELLLGAILALAPNAMLSLSKGTRELASGLGLLGIASAVMLFDHKTLFPGMYAVLPCAGATLFLWSNQAGLTYSGAVMTWSPLVYIGRISYSLYLAHWPVNVLYSYWDWKSQEWWQKCLLVLLSSGLAIISYHLIETPVRKRWILRSRRSLFMATFASVIVLVTASGVIHVKQGFSNRLSEQTKIALSAQAPDRGYTYPPKTTLKHAVQNDFPILGKADGDRSCLLWGDSHAWALIPVVDAACKEVGIRLQAATQGATPPLKDFASHITRTFSPIGQFVPQYNDRILTVAKTGDFEVIVIASYWTNYADEPTFEMSLRQTVKELVDAKKRVILVRDVANQPTEIPKVVARALWHGGDASMLGVQLVDHRAKNKKADEILLSLVNEQVVVVDPAPYFVDENGLWRAELDWEPVYSDRDHLTAKASLRLKPMFLELLKK